MYAADHLPPHFHVRMNDGREALVEIATLAVLRGSAAKRIGAAYPCKDIQQVDAG